MRGYKRPTNDEFNIHLAKRLADRKCKQPNVERSQANVDAWLKDLEEHRAKGEPTAFEQACQKTLDKFKQPHSDAWWWRLVIVEFARQCGEKVWEFIRRLAKRIGKRTY
jgi:hypothetical protein